MTIAYCDTSAIVRYLTAEAGSGLVATIWNKSDAVITSALTDLEVHAVLHAGERAQLLTPEQRQSALDTWDDLKQELFVVPYTTTIQHEAIALTATYRLRAADAAHLASARQCGIMPQIPILIVAWDEALRRAASAEGLFVTPYSIG